jgi:hypothetical protein
MRNHQLHPSYSTGCLHLTPQLRIGGHAPTNHDTTGLALASSFECLRYQDIHHRLLKARCQVRHLLRRVLPHGMQDRSFDAAEAKIQGVFLQIRAGKTNGS